jgi:hypothetical protein
LYRDNHPTPEEHLLYLQWIYPDLHLQTKTLDFVKEMNDVVLSKNFKPNEIISMYRKNVYPRLGTDRNYE